MESDVGAAETEESVWLEEVGGGTRGWRAGERGSRASGTLLGLGGGFGHSWLSEPRIAWPVETQTHSHDVITQDVSSVAIVGLFLEPNFYQIVSFPSGERKALVCLVQIRHNRCFIFYWTINKSEQHSMSKSIRLI